MKIVCESCGTKYSIADEKVSGKVFKLRCKKCSHVIVVKGTSESEAAQTGTPSATQGETAAEQAAAPSDAVWHLVVDREQIGPMTPAEVRAKFAAGQIDGETYTWREGFDDWLKLAAVDEFRDLAAQPRANGEHADDQATRRSDMANLFRGTGYEEPAPGADLFAGAGAAAHVGVTSSPTAATIMASSPLAPLSSASSGRGAQAPAGDVVSASAAPSSSVDIRPMTGARSENSVLFSLNNLQALATGGAPAPSGGGPRPGFADSKTEGSGLIDIRAMAAQTLSANSFSVGTASKPDELPLVNEAPLFSPVAPAVLMPIAEPQGMPKWVWAVVGVGGVTVLGMIAVIIWVLRAPPPIQPVPAQPGPAVATGPGENPSPGAGPSAQPASPGSAPAAVPGKGPGKDESAAAAAPGDEKKRKREKGERGERERKEGKEPQAKGKEPAAAPPPPTPEPPAERKPPKPSKPKDDLDALLEGATGGATGGKPRGESAKKDAPEQLSMEVIKSGLKSVNGAVQACNQGSPGTYVVKLTIGRNGRVSDASVPGKAGDPTADCVVRAVKGARFPEFTGDPQSLSYPFILR